ncbi:MAG TPA: alpha/beta fold hydrolase [Xanthobacteraceae bacterium]|nr:alpha/beta fold hydrolase [Xanthobacteraceae bacterium]
MSIPRLSFIAVVAACLFGASAAAQTPEENALAATRLLSEGHFADLAAQFTPQVASALPVDRLAQTWQGVVAQAGPLRGTGTPRETQQGGLTIVIVPLRFERASLDLVLSYQQGKIAGLFIRPAQAPPHAWTPPAYDDAAAHHDLDVTVGAAPALPATLTLPRVDHKVAAVVLVHGSGPNDRNEAIGPNRPFEDIADGLASRGIAVLRYDKRTKIEPQAFAPTIPFTVREEVIDDARAAVALLRARPEIDPRRIVVIGHSLGATLAPRVAKDDADVAGIVLLAAAARPLADIIVEQSEYLASLDGAPNAQTQAKIDALKATAARADAVKPGDNGAPIMNLPRSYWADLNAYDPAATAATLTIPMLVLQGGRDYQVTARDFDRFRAALAGHANATLILLPRLDHLLIAGDGKSTPAEYTRPGHVDRQVIDDIVAFIAHLPG